MEITSELVEQAIIFAIKAHKGQKRKGNGLPYIMHPMRVASVLQEVKESKNMNLLIISSLLHDTVEDTGVKLTTIAKKFGHQVAALVEELTLDKDLYETVGKTELLCQEVLKMTSYALCIKLCDRLDNVRDLKAMKESFRAKYVPETRTILDTLKQRKLTGTHQKLISLIELELEKYSTN
jgi:(p)ppGpp synthase/HD superfamily hydrolase